MNQCPDNQAPHKDGPAPMSSIVRKMLFASLLVISAAALAVTLTPDSSGNGSLTATAPKPAASPALPVAAPVVTPGIAGALMSWDQLRQTDNAGFADYANFMMAHPGWPGEARMRRLAESKADSTLVAPALITRFFSRFPPNGATGKAHYADALMITGREMEARAMARQAWVAGSLPSDIETRLLSRFGTAFTATDQDQRMERLLAQRSITAALRQIIAVSAERRPMYEARLSLQLQRPDAAALSDALGAAALRDPGFVADRAVWLRDTGQSLAARTLLATPLQLVAPPLDPEKWLETLLGFARSANSDGQGDLAYGIALNADQALPAGSDIRKEDLGVRDDYTSLVWLGGQSALRQTQRPRDAAAMFDRYARAAQTPQTQTKGWYWAGRAMLVAGDRTRADGYFMQASQNGDQFYGQLAAERLGRPAGIIPPTPAVQVSPTARAAFDGSEMVQAVRYLGSLGRWQDQTVFIRTIAQNVKDEVDHMLAGELARNIARPDLGVMVARNWRNSGAGDPIRIGFPEVALSAVQRSQWTIIHAITRQESQFDRQIVSHAGARGLMQLMPGTARETATKLGLPYDFDRLTSDPAYNIMLGSAFFARLLDNYGGNYVLSVAAYNAGPGNVRKWLTANGDPRMPGVDVIDWIEAIPISETRGYVQRVLENAVVYDLLNPGGPTMPSQYRLSAFLGKNVPG